jgi:SOR/SNZ family
VNLLGSDALTADRLLHNLLRIVITIIAFLERSINMSATDNGNSTFVVKAGLAKMLKGGVIMDVINVEQAKIAEAAGAVAVMALERIPADIRYDGGVARMSDPAMINEIRAAVTIPVMAKVNHLSQIPTTSPQQKNSKRDDVTFLYLQRFASDTSSKLRYWRQLKWTTLTRVKSLRWLTRRTTSTSTTSKYLLYADAET